MQECGISHTGGACAYQYNDIQSCQARLIVAETLADQTLDSITRNGCFNLPFRYCQTKSRNFLSILSCQHAEVGVADFYWTVKNVLEF